MEHLKKVEVVKRRQTLRGFGISNAGTLCLITDALILVVVDIDMFLMTAPESPVFV